MCDVKRFFQSWKMRIWIGLLTYWRDSEEVPPKTSARAVAWVGYLQNEWCPGETFTYKFELMICAPGCGGRLRWCWSRKYIHFATKCGPLGQRGWLGSTSVRIRLILPLRWGGSSTRTSLLKWMLMENAWKCLLLCCDSLDPRTLRLKRALWVYDTVPTECGIWGIECKTVRVIWMKHLTNLSYHITRCWNVWPHISRSTEFGVMRAIWCTRDNWISIWVKIWQALKLATPDWRWC